MIKCVFWLQIFANINEASLIIMEYTLRLHYCHFTKLSLLAAPDVFIMETTWYSQRRKFRQANMATFPLRY